jgi:hypothetical protein
MNSQKKLFYCFLLDVYYSGNPKFKNFEFVFFKINIFLIFLNFFNTLISKIIFKK